MGSKPSKPPPERVLVVGATGRTGRRLVQRLCADPRYEVTALVRDTDKAQRTFGDEQVQLVEGDLHDVGAWAHHLSGVSQVVTAVSCGQWTDPQVVLGIRPAPANMPQRTDAEGIAALASAAKEHGVSRIVAVTTASAGSPWSPAAIFLNTVHYASVKHKWRGEQAIRDSGIDYVVLRPYGLGPDAPAAQPAAADDQSAPAGAPAPPPPPPPRGVEWSQGAPVGRERRRIPRDDVARLCHEALDLPAGAVAPRATFECWATAEHARPMGWGALRADPPGALPEVDHDAPVAALLGTGGLAAAGLLSLSWRASGRFLQAMLRRMP